MAVNIVERRGNLIDDVSDLLMREGVIVQLAHLHHAVQIHIKKFKNHVQGVLMTNHFHTSYYIWMLQANHRFDLGVSHGRFPRGKLALKSLQGVDLFGFLVCNLVNNSKAAFA